MNFDPAKDISDWFWRVIAGAAGDRSQLRTILNDLERDEINKFHDEFLEASAQLNDEPFNQYMSPDISEDGEQDICHWVVSQGLAFYKLVWSDPAKIPQQIEADDPGNFFEIADEVYEERFGQEIGI